VYAASGWHKTWMIRTVHAGQVMVLTDPYNTGVGNRAAPQKTSSNNEGKRNAESGLIGLLVGFQSSTDPVLATAAASVVAVEKRVTPAALGHILRGIGFFREGLRSLRK
jgi:hypothetical protein